MDLAGFDVAGKEGVALFVHKILAIEPEGNFVQHLIVLVFLVGLGHGFPSGLVHLVIVRPGGVDAALRQIPGAGDVVKGPGGKGEGKGVGCLPAGDIQAVEAGEFLFGLLALLLSLAPDGREEQMGIVLPEEPGFLAQICELAQAACFPEPETGFVAVLLLVAVGDSEGGPLAIRGKLGLSQEAVAQEVG